MNTFDNIDPATQRRTLWVAYVLHLLLFTSPVGFVLNLLRLRDFKRLPADEREHLPDALVAVRSHHEWLMRTFMVTTVLAMMGLGSVYYGVGYLVWAIAGVWWIYRLARGIVGLIGARPMPVWT